MYQPTEIGTFNDEDIKQFCQTGWLIKEGYDPRNVQQACYELRASDIYYDLATGEKHVVTADDYILLKPHQMTVVITEESLKLPDDILGRILTKGKLFSIGVLPVNTYADPGFTGRLGIVLYNASNNYIKIHPLQSIAKIEFTKLQKQVIDRYVGQHGYQTEIWPIPSDSILSPDEIKKDKRIKSSTEEIILSYGKPIGQIMDRIFRFEKYLIFTIIAYISFSMLLIFLAQGTDWISPTSALLLGVGSNIITSLLTYLAINLRR